MSVIGKLLGRGTGFAGGSAEDHTVNKVDDGSSQKRAFEHGFALSSDDGKNSSISDGISGGHSHQYNSEAGNIEGDLSGEVYPAAPSSATTSAAKKSNNNHNNYYEDFVFLSSECDEVGSFSDNSPNSAISATFSLAGLDTFEAPSFFKRERAERQRTITAFQRLKAEKSKSDEERKSAHVLRQKALSFESSRRAKAKKEFDEAREAKRIQLAKGRIHNTSSIPDTAATSQSGEQRKIGNSRLNILGHDNENFKANRITRLPARRFPQLSCDGNNASSNFGGKQPKSGLSDNTLGAASTRGKYSYDCKRRHRRCNKSESKRRKSFPGSTNTKVIEFSGTYDSLLEEDKMYSNRSSYKQVPRLSSLFIVSVKKGKIIKKRNS